MAAGHAGIGGAASAGIGSWYEILADSLAHGDAQQDLARRALSRGLLPPRAGFFPQQEDSRESSREGSRDAAQRNPGAETNFGRSRSEAPRGSLPRQTGAEPGIRGGVHSQ